MSWDNARLTKEEKWGETKRIQYLEVDLYWFHENRTKMKRFTENLYLTLCVYLSRIRLSPWLSHFVHFGWYKEKKKKSNYIFIRWRCCLFFFVYNDLPVAVLSLKFPVCLTSYLRANVWISAFYKRKNTNWNANRIRTRVVDSIFPDGSRNINCPSHGVMVSWLISCTNNSVDSCKPTMNHTSWSWVY